MNTASALLVALLLARCEAPEPGAQTRRASWKTMSDLPTLSVRRFGPETSDAPLIVLLHGFGAPGDDLVPLAHELMADSAYRFVVPEAPIPLAEGGRAWWPIDFGSRQAQLERGDGLDLRAEHPAELPHARAQVEALIERLTERDRVPRKRIALVGFSQGAMLSFDTLLHAPEAVACVAMLSGSFIAEREWTPRLAARRDVPLFMSHGTRDPILPFSLSRQLRDTLQRQGYRVTWQEFSGGHEIPFSVVRALRAFLRDCFGT